MTWTPDLIVLAIGMTIFSMVTTYQISRIILTVLLLILLRLRPE